MRTALTLPFKASGLALWALLSVACTDDKPAASKRPLLVDKTWIAVYYGLDGEDVTDEQDACALDDVTTFHADGTLSEDIQDTPCDELDEDSEGSWAFKSNETILSMQVAGEPASDWKVLELTKSTLRISQYAAALKMEIVVVMTAL